MKHYHRSMLFALALFSVAAMFSATARADDGHHHKADKTDNAAETDKEGKVTLEGEILDLYCFMKHPDDGQGADHAKCARTCILKGLPIGFMVDDKVYLIVGKDHESAAELVVELAGKPSRITGVMTSHHGMDAIEIESIEEI